MRGGSPEWRAPGEIDRVDSGGHFVENRYSHICEYTGDPVTSSVLLRGPSDFDLRFDPVRLGVDRDAGHLVHVRV